MGLMPQLTGEGCITRGSTTGSYLFNEKTVLGKRYFAHFSADFLFLSEEISDNHLAMFRPNEIDRLQQQLFFIILF